jgi:hypothetical protein
MFIDHTQRRTTVGRTPLDERSARRRDFYLTTRDTHNRQISMPPVGFEPKISAVLKMFCDDSWHTIWRRQICTCCTLNELCYPGSYLKIFFFLSNSERPDVGETLLSKV